MSTSKRRPASAAGPSPTLLSRLQLLADENRLTILVVISERPLNVTELAEASGMPMHFFARQLRYLRLAGIVGLKKEGHYHRYGVVEKYGRFVEAVLAMVERRPEG